MQRAVAKHRAAFDAFAATDTEWLINGIFVIRIFDEITFDCAGGAELIFGSGVELVGLRLEIAGAELAVTAHIKTVNAFHG